MSYAISTSLFYLFPFYLLASQGSYPHKTITLVILYIYLTFQLHLWFQIPIETIQASQCGLHPSKIWMFSSAFFSILFSLHTFSNKVGIYIWVLIQYLPLYIYGNLSNLGNVHILSLFPLAFYEMLLLPFCAKTAHFLIYFLVSLNTHTSTILPIFWGFFILFAYLWTICITIHQFYCNNTYHICYIYYNRHIYNLTSIF